MRMPPPKAFELSLSVASTFANRGEYRLTFSGSRVTFTQRNDRDNYSTAGPFRVQDDLVTLVFDEGGNAGEIFRSRWSLFRGFAHVPPRRARTGPIRPQAMDQNRRALDGKARSATATTSDSRNS
jgi:hypothetical protein